jgi:hypothetical protein
MIKETERFIVQLSELLLLIRANRSEFVSKQNLRHKLTAVSKKWLQELTPHIRASGKIADAVVNELDSTFERILSLAGSNNRKKSYVKHLKDATQVLQQSVLVPLIKSTPTTSLLDGITAKVLAQNLSAEQKNYLKEAFVAARAGCFKAATVMTWCAIIDRLRSFVLSKGLGVYSQTSTALKQNGTGFYKYFKNEVNITMENELQEIFDRNLIIVISGMNNALDINQAKALLGLFDKRNSSAHPSATVVDELAFASFLNELNALVFTNPKLT